MNTTHTMTDMRPVTNQISTLGFWQFHVADAQIHLSADAARLCGLNHHAHDSYALADIHACIVHEDRDILAESWRNALQSGQYEASFRIQLNDSQTRWLWANAQLAFNPKHKPIYANGIVQDISPHHDKFTGQLNRQLLLERLFETIYLKQKTPSILLIQLEALPEPQAITTPLLYRCKMRIQQTIPNADLVVYLGNHTFAVLLSNHHDEQLYQLALLLLKQLSPQSGQANNHIGIATWHELHHTPEDLLNEAELALQQAQTTSTHLMFANCHMQQQFVSLCNWQDSLHQALQQQELRLLYQPIYHFPQRSVNHVSASAHWQHPKQGLISAETFGEVATSCGLSQELGRWTIQEACKQMQLWKNAGRTLTISIKLSEQQIPEGISCNWLGHILKHYQIDASSIIFELNETTLLRTDHTIHEWIYRAEKLGIRFALAQFGTGAISLALLHQFNLQRITIDPTLLHNLSTNARTRALVQTLVDIGRNMMLQVVADGVNNERSLFSLQSMGCYDMQGSYLSQPLTAEQLSQQLRKTTSTPHTRN